MKTFHVAQHPYSDSAGNIRASYQYLNAKGYAIAVVDITNGEPFSLRYSSSMEVAKIPGFIDQARASFAAATPIVFA
jgi:hypothetical protein